VNKKILGELMVTWFNLFGATVTANMADRIKTVGFHFATQAGISIGLSDLIVPSTKKQLLNWAQDEINKLNELLEDRLLSKEVHSDRSFEIWRQVTGKITEEMKKSFGKHNSVFMMASSGARGNMDQVRQLAGMRGLMADAKGNTVRVPIRSNFKEGLSLTEYFISSYGARKGVVDTAENTAKSGFLTRRFVDVAQDTVITSEDCGTKENIAVSAVRDESGELLMGFGKRLTGRYTAEKVVDPKTGEVICKSNELITQEIGDKIEKAEIERVRIKSALTCRLERGVCKKCYGIDLSRNKPVELGEAVGIIAGQSIGEPGTQLTMRTFHTGGADLSSAVKEEVKAQKAGTIEFSKKLQHTTIADENGVDVTIVTEKGDLVDKTNSIKYYVRPGTKLLIKDGAKVEKGQVMGEYSHSYEYVISENEGIVRFIGIDPEKVVQDSGSAKMIRASEDDMVLVYREKDKIKEYQIFEGKEKLVKLSTKLEGVDFNIVNNNGDFEVTKDKEAFTISELKKPTNKALSKEEAENLYALLKEFILNPAPVTEHEDKMYMMKYKEDKYEFYCDYKLLCSVAGQSEAKKELDAKIFPVFNELYLNLFYSDAKYMAVAKLGDVEYSVGMAAEGLEVYKNGELTQRMKTVNELDLSKFSIEFDHINALFDKLPKRGKSSEASERLFNSMYSLKKIKFGFGVYKGKKIIQVIEADNEKDLYNPEFISNLKGTNLSEKELSMIEEAISNARSGQKEIVAEKARKKFNLVRVDGWFQIFKNKNLLQVIQDKNELDQKAFSEEINHVKILFQKLPVKEVSAEASVEFAGFVYQIRRVHELYEIYKANDFLCKVNNENQIESELVEVLTAKEIEVVKDLFQGVKRKVELVTDKKVVDNKLVVTTVAAERYNMVEGEHILVLVKEGAKVKTSDILVIKQVKYERARDIVAGLPKVDALFDAVNDSKRVEFAVFAETDGLVEITERADKRTITIKEDKTGKKKKAYDIYWWTKLRVYDGQRVSRGEQLTEGTKRPQDVLKFLGVKATQQYLLDDIQKAYLSQGVSINDKHIEIIIRRMTVRVRVIDIGDSPYQIGEFVNRYTIDAVNLKLAAEGKNPARTEDIVLGIRRAALNTESFFSAASFTDTRSVLTNAAVTGKIDPMLGLKENVIIGKLIPAGTGIKDYSNVILHAVDEGDSLEPVAERLEEEIFSV